MGSEECVERLFKGRVSYLGTAFKGWQVQPGKKTVQGSMIRVLNKVLHHDVVLTGASRTDAGVHAHDQRFSFKTTNAIPLENVQRAMNHHLPREIRVRDLQLAALDFSARHHALGKHYGYIIYNRAQGMAPFVAPFGWRYGLPLDENAMREAALHLIGHHDFGAFQARDDFREDTMLTLIHVGVERMGPCILIDVVGPRFLKHMIRILVGSLVAVGRGAWTVAEFCERFASGQREHAGMTSPGHGLHLWQVFDQPPPWDVRPHQPRFVSSILHIDGGLSGHTLGESDQ